MAINQIKTGAVLSYLAIGLSNLVGILYTPFMLRMLGQSEYGMFSLAVSVVGYLTVLDMGFGNAIVRYTARFRAENKVEKQWSLFGMFILFYSLIGIITLFLGWILYFNVDKLFDNTMDIEQLAQMRIMVILMVVNLALTFVFGIFGSIIIAYQRFVWQQLINIVRIVLQPCIMVVILWLGYKAVAMIVVMTLMNICVLGINCWFCFSKLNVRVQFNAWDKKLFKEICGYSFFIFIGSIIDKLYWSTGQFVLGMFTGTVAVAIYAVAMQLKGYYMSFANAISTLFLPKVTSMVTYDIPHSELSDLFIRVGRIQFIILGFIMTGFISFGKLFIFCWAGENYSSSYIIALILMLPLSVPLLQSLGYTILQAQAKLKFRAYLYLGIAILSLLFSIPITKQYGGIGCAIVTSLCLLLGHGIIMNVYYQKVIHLNVVRFWKEIGKMLLPVCWLPLPTLILLNKFSSTWLTLSVGVVLFSVVYLGVLYSFSLNKQERVLVLQPLSKIKKKIWK